MRIPNEGSYYLVMEYCANGVLDALLKEGPLSQELSAKYVTQVGARCRLMYDVYHDKYMDNYM